MHSQDEFHDGASVGKDPSAEPVRTPAASSGFGSPGSDSTVKRIDLNDALIRHPQATFVMRAAGGAMHRAGIGNGDVLLVDRAIQPRSGNIVIAAVEGELICRRFVTEGRVVKLQAADPAVADIVPGEGTQLEIWGVVTTAIKSFLG